MFKVKGDTITVYPSYGEHAYRVHFFGDEIEEIESFDVIHNKVIEKFEKLTIYPANLFVTSQEVLQNAIFSIQEDLMKQYEYAENGIQLEVKKAFSDLQVSDKNIITSQKSLTQAKENWRITDLQYKEQIATSTDVLDARTELTQAESNYISALYGYMVALADLERAIGKKYFVPDESALLE